VENTRRIYDFRDAHLSPTRYIATGGDNFPAGR